MCYADLSTYIDDVMSPRHSVPQPTAAPQAERHLPSPLDVTQAADDVETESSVDSQVTERHKQEETEKRSEEMGNQSETSQSEEGEIEIKALIPQVIDNSRYRTS